MDLVGQETCPLPEDRALADAAVALRDTGHWGWVVDHAWRLVYMTDEVSLTGGGGVALAPMPIGVHLFGPESVRIGLQWRMGANTVDRIRASLAGVGGLVLADTPGGRDELRALVDPSLRDMVDGLAAAPDATTASFSAAGAGLGGEDLAIPALAWRVRRADGRLAGTVMISKPAAGMATLGALAMMADQRHLQRMLSVSKAGRRPAAILLADLEASSPLARRVSTASYFALGRRLVRAADRCVIEAGGIVGRYVGDGVAAFFLAETAGSESAAARECISAARMLRTAVGDVAVRSDLRPEDVVLRFGLHWGSTLYVGNITTGGRVEVTALGDEVNEAARIEACASGGRALASKALMERLEPDDAAALDLDPDRITYTSLADLDTATNKTRRDAPALAVCEV